MQHLYARKQEMSISNNRKNIILSIIIFFIIKPIYIFSSGNLQICDFFLILAIIYEVLRSRWKIKLYWNSGIYKLLLSLILFQTCVNLCWYFLYSDERLMYSSLFYIYNTFAFFYFATCGIKNGLEAIKKSCAYGAVLSSIICILGIVVNASINARGLGFFNNPNQLGLHGILLLTVVFYTGEHLGRFTRYFIIILSLIIIFASASKAAFLASIGLLIMFILFFNRDTSIWNKARKLILLLFVSAGVFLFFYEENSFITSNYTVMYLRKRILAMSSESDSNLALGRGYARISELGASFVWGLGEGAYSRFSIMTNHEVHSTFANIIVSYGLVGILGYFFLLRQLFRNHRVTVFNICGFSGVILYSITHNSIRNTIIWLLFSILFLEKYYKNINNKTMNGNL